jgi:dTDP-glucose 4,6-dehydratase
MPTAVVTGGAGFLGSHLCDHLLARDYRVICIDNLETGSLENIAHVGRGPQFDFRYHDVVEYIEIDEAVDVVYHLAALASPVDDIRLPRHSV